MPRTNGSGSAHAEPPKLAPTAELSSQQRSARVDFIWNQVQSATQQVQTLMQAASNEAALLIEMRGRLDEIDAIVRDHADRLMAQRTLWQRLRWIARGR